jgi:hypothetical protein
LRGSRASELLGAEPLRRVLQRLRRCLGLLCLRRRRRRGGSLKLALRLEHPTLL